MSAVTLHLVLSDASRRQRAHRTPRTVGKQMVFSRVWLKSETEPFRDVGIEWQPEVEWENFPFQVSQNHQRLYCSFRCPAAGKYRRAGKCHSLMVAVATQFRRNGEAPEMLLSSWYGPARRQRGLRYRDIRMIGGHGGRCDC
jgi:hypothetical protein